MASKNQPYKARRGKVGRDYNLIRAEAVAKWAARDYDGPVGRQIAKDYGISIRTLYKWRQDLKALAAVKAAGNLDAKRLAKRALNDVWTDQLGDALIETIQRIRHLVAESDNLSDVVEAFKALSEIEITKGILNVAANAPENRGYEESSTPAPGSTIPTPGTRVPDTPTLPD